jgi:hypothetical protein
LKVTTANKRRRPLDAGAGSPQGRERAAHAEASLDDEQRGQLADDVRGLAGFADATVDKATPLGAEVPEGVVACPVVWRRWAAGGLGQKRR